jgi:ATP-dependent helicase Lhr and Lhr-like helicase
MAPDAFHFLTIALSSEIAQETLLPPLRTWFASEFGAPTLAQRYAWPTIQRGQHLLLSSPTGSGKTLAGFLPIISDIIAKSSHALRCLYVAPLKALGRDVRVNLKKTWRSVQNAGHFADIDLRIGLRTGDTSQRVRRRHLSDPPSILLTTPESLAQMLAQPSGRDLFASLRWVILDEIHALCDNKRGADLALSLERLDAMCDHADGVQRIGLSATCAPIAAVAEFLVGTNRPCTIAQVPDATENRFTIEPLFESLDYAPSWMAALMDRLLRELTTGATTLISTNTRSLAERITWALKRRHPDRLDEIAVHHSAISATRRRRVERCLKQGRLWTVVCSTSLELGIDIGTVDNVVFVHPPGGVVRLLQRVGRSGHRPDQPRRGLLLTASPGELLEAAVTASGGRDGQIEALRIVDAPLDVLCQQLVGMATTDTWSAEAAYELVRRAAPYRNLAWSDFQDCLDYLSGLRRDGTVWLPARLQRQGACFTISDERIARLLRRNLGSIITEDTCAIRLRTPTEENDAHTQMLGDVDQSYAERLQPGDRFVLDGRCLEVKKQNGETMLVDEVFGRPQIPRWQGSGVPMSSDLARRIFVFRAHAAETLRESAERLRHWLRTEFHLDDGAIDPLVSHLLHQETASEIPTLVALLIEGVALQSCMEYFVHTPLPRSANEAIVRVLLHRWRRMHKPAATALVTDLGFYLVVHESEPASPQEWREGLSAHSFIADLHEHLHDSELLRQQFARVAQTGLMVLRNAAGRKRKVGGKDWAQRRLFEQVRNRMSDFVLLRQAERETITSTCDLALALAFVENLASMQIRVRQLPQPSPFGESLLRVGFPTASITGEPAAEYAEMS